jgi:hypothetical protein
VYSITNSENPVILFIPEAGVYPFMRGLSILGDAIQKQGGRVLVTHDTGQMLRSPLLGMNKVPVPTPADKKAEVYKSNEQIFKSALKKYKFTPIELAELVGEELQKEIDDVVSGAGDDLENIIFRGFPVGKIAQYDFILETKFPYSPKLSELHKALYAIYIKNTALTIALTDTICERYHPSLLLTFNEYAQCQAVRYSAEKHKVGRMAMTYPTHYNVDASKFSIWKTTCEYWRYVHCQKWNTEKDTPIRKEHVLECWKDTLFRMYGSGSHIFSARKENDPGFIFKKLNLDPRRKTIVVYTSSQDERGSVEIAMKIWREDNHVIDAFPNQIAWLVALRDYVLKRDDVQIVVRIHPREGTRGAGFDSEHLQKLRKTFTENTSNFIIVWPDEPISSYDLMELADVCLVAWSLMGQEAARLGIPVLSFTGNMFYPDDDFMQVATAPEEYFKRLDSILTMGYTWYHLVKAVRFYHWRIFLTSLDLGETVPRTFDDNTLWPEAPLSTVEVITNILSDKKDLITYNLEEWKSSLAPDAIVHEAEAMRQGIRRFIDSVFYPPDPEKKPSFLFRVFRRVIRELTGKNLPLTKKKRSVFY